jgi:hypothetical protein
MVRYARIVTRRDAVTKLAVIAFALTACASELPPDEVDYPTLLEDPAIADHEFTEVTHGLVIGRDLLEGSGPEGMTWTVMLTEWFNARDFTAYDLKHSSGSQLEDQYVQLCAIIESSGDTGVCGLMCQPGDFAARVLEGSETCRDVDCSVGTSTLSFTVCP